MAKYGVHHIALAVENFDEVVEFYTNGLGMELRGDWVNPQGKKGCLINIGDGSHVEIFEQGNKEEPVNPYWLHLALSVDNVDEAYELALKSGATPHIEPKDITIQTTPSFDIRMAFVKGVGGELIEFFKEL